MGVMTSKVSAAMRLPAGDRPVASNDTEDLIQIVGQYESKGAPVVEPDLVLWLLGEGRRIVRDAEFFDAVCWRLLGAGLVVSRISLSVFTLHPQIVGLNFRWWRDRHVTEVLRVGYGVQQTADYFESPIRTVIENGATVHFRLADQESIAPYPLLVKLRDGGASGYFACPLTFFNGRHQATTWTTDRPGGFNDADIAQIQAILPVLAVVIEARSMHRLAGTLLNIYLGRTAGQRILEGDIRRAQGEGERMSAIILASDMRGFTSLSDRLPGGELIALLDDYFDVVTAPVQARGGEVLKFVGDGILAIFPLGGCSPADAAESALAAVDEVFTRVAALNAERRTIERTEFRFGIGLHIGDVIFGNVGAVDRLDFTVIGPAVNLAFRLETLTKRLGRDLLVSHDFARACRRPLVSLGFHPVKGLSEPEEVFGLGDHVSAI
jgi:adenylate cyclase